MVSRISLGSKELTFGRKDVLTRLRTGSGSGRMNSNCVFLKCVGNGIVSIGGGVRKMCSGLNTTRLRGR